MSQNSSKKSRWTATVSFLVCESSTIIREKSFHFDETSELDGILEAASVNWFSIIGEVKLTYNGNLGGKPISMAQLFFEGDIEPAGGVH